MGLTAWLRLAYERRRHGRESHTIKLQVDVIPGKVELVIPVVTMRAWRNSYHRANRAKRRELTLQLVRQHTQPRISDQWLPYADRLARLAPEDLDKVAAAVADNVNDLLEKGE